MVNLKPIRTEDAYKEAMAALAMLWGAADGTPESDQLDILATLIEKYEEAQFPMDLPDPFGTTPDWFVTDLGTEQDGA